MTPQGDQLSAPTTGDQDIEQVLLGLADGSYVLSTPDGLIAECGVGVAGLLGVPAQRLARRAAADVLVPGADSAAKSAFGRLLLADGADPAAARTFRAQTAGGSSRSLRFVVVAVPLALGWEFTSLLGELGSRDAGTWRPEALRTRHGRALEAIEGVVRDGIQPDASARLAGILIIVRDVDAPALTHTDVDRRTADQRAAARATATEAARHIDEAAGRRASGSGVVREPPGLEDLVERARILRERLEEAEHDAAAARSERDDAAGKLARAEAERDTASERSAGLQAACDGRVEQLTGERDEVRGSLDEAHRELAAARTGAESARAEARAARSELQAVGAEAQTAATAAEAARADAASARSDLDASRGAGQAAAAAAGAARAEAESARADADRARAELLTIRAAVEAQLAAQEASADAERVPSPAETAAAQAEADALRAELQTAHAELQTAQGELQTARGELHAAHNESSLAHGEASAIRAELRHTSDALASTRHALEDAHGTLNTMPGQLDAVEGELAAARTELGGTRAELEAVRTELDHTRGELGASLAAAAEICAEREQAKVRAGRLLRDAERDRAAADAIRAELVFDADPADAAAPLQGTPSQGMRSPWSRPAPVRVEAAVPAEPRPDLPPAEPGQAAALIALDGSFKRLDEAFCSLLGCREEDLRYARWPSIIDRDNLKAHQELARALTAGEIESAEVETVYMHAQGLLVPIAGTVSMHRAEPAGEPTHFLFRADVSRTAGVPGIT
jgi:PAS domain S-box-containing protein